jgi:hypothetical protein
MTLREVSLASVGLGCLFEVGLRRCWCCDGWCMVYFWPSWVEVVVKKGLEGPFYRPGGEHPGAKYNDIHRS